MLDPRRKNSDFGFTFFLNEMEKNSFRLDRDLQILNILIKICQLYIDE